MLSVVHNYRGSPRRKKITTRPYKSAERPLRQSEKRDQVPGPDPAPDPPKSAARKPPGRSGEPGRLQHNGKAQSRGEGCHTAMDSGEATEHAVRRSPERSPRSDAGAPTSSSRRAPPRPPGDAKKKEEQQRQVQHRPVGGAEEGVEAAAHPPSPPRPVREGAAANATKPPKFLATTAGQERRLGSRSTRQGTSS
jgi:hypothetical protein